MHIHKSSNDEERATRILHVDLSGPHVYSWPDDYCYLLVAVARVQKKDGTSYPLLPFSRPLPSKASNSVARAVDDIIGQIEATTLPEAAAGQRITRLHTDKGTEYLGNVMEERLHQRMIHHTKTMGYDPKANGMAERFVGIIKDSARKILQAAKMTDNFWCYATEHAAEWRD